jgi:hypothetical protein
VLTKKLIKGVFYVRRAKPGESSWLSNQSDKVRRVHRGKTLNSTFTCNNFLKNVGEKFHDNPVVALADFRIDSDQRRALYPLLYHYLVWPRGMSRGAFSVFIAGIFLYRSIVYVDCDVIGPHASLVPGVKTQNGGQNHGRNVAGSHTR